MEKYQDPVAAHQELDHPCSETVESTLFTTQRPQHSSLSSQDATLPPDHGTSVLGRRGRSDISYPHSPLGESQGSSELDFDAAQGTPPAKLRRISYPVSSIPKQLQEVAVVPSPAESKLLTITLALDKLLTANAYPSTTETRKASSDPLHTLTKEHLQAPYSDSVFGCKTTSDCIDDNRPPHSAYLSTLQWIRVFHTNSFSKLRSTEASHDTNKGNIPVSALRNNARRLLSCDAEAPPDSPAVIFPKGGQSSKDAPSLNIDTQLNNLNSYANSLFQLHYDWSQTSEGASNAPYNLKASSASLTWRAEELCRATEAALESCLTLLLPTQQTSLNMPSVSPILFSDPRQANVVSSSIRTFAMTILSHLPIAVEGVCSALLKFRSLAQTPCQDDNPAISTHYQGGSHNEICDACHALADVVTSSTMVSLCLFRCLRMIISTDVHIAKCAPVSTYTATSSHGVNVSESSRSILPINPVSQATSATSEYLRAFGILNSEAQSLDRTSHISMINDNATTMPATLASSPRAAFPFSILPLSPPPQLLSLTFTSVFYHLLSLFADYPVVFLPHAGNLASNLDNTETTSHLNSTYSPALLLICATMSFVDDEAQSSPSPSHLLISTSVWDAIERLFQWHVAHNRSPYLLWTWLMTIILPLSYPSARNHIAHRSAYTFTPSLIQKSTDATSPFLSTCMNTLCSLFTLMRKHEDETVGSIERPEIPWHAVLYDICILMHMISATSHQVLTASPLAGIFDPLQEIFLFFLTHQRLLIQCANTHIDLSQPPSLTTTSPSLQSQSRILPLSESTWLTSFLLNHELPSLSGSDRYLVNFTDHPQLQVCYLLKSILELIPLNAQGLHRIRHLLLLVILWGLQGDKFRIHSPIGRTLEIPSHCPSHLRCSCCLTSTSVSKSVPLNVVTSIPSCLASPSASLPIGTIDTSSQALTGVLSSLPAASGGMAQSLRIVIMSLLATFACHTLNYTAQRCNHSPPSSHPSSTQTILQPSNKHVIQLPPVELDAHLHDVWFYFARFSRAFGVTIDTSQQPNLSTLSASNAGISIFRSYTTPSIHQNHCPRATFAVACFASMVLLRGSRLRPCQDPPSVPLNALRQSLVWMCSWPFARMLASSQNPIPHLERLTDNDLAPLQLHALSTITVTMRMFSALISSLYRLPACLVVSERDNPRCLPPSRFALGVASTLWDPSLKYLLSPALINSDSMASHHLQNQRGEPSTVITSVLVMLSTNIPTYSQQGPQVSSTVPSLSSHHVTSSAMDETPNMPFSWNPLVSSLWRSNFMPLSGLARRIYALIPALRHLVDVYLSLPILPCDSMAPQPPITTLPSVSPILARRILTVMVKTVPLLVAAGTITWTEALLPFVLIPGLNWRSASTISVSNTTTISSEQQSTTNSANNLGGPSVSNLSLLAKGRILNLSLIYLTHLISGDHFVPFTLTYCIRDNARQSNIFLHNPLLAVSDIDSSLLPVNDILSMIPLHLVLLILRHIIGAALYSPTPPALFPLCTTLFRHPCFNALFLNEECQTVLTSLTSQPTSSSATTRSHPLVPLLLHHINDALTSLYQRLSLEIPPHQVASACFPPQVSSSPTRVIMPQTAIFVAWSGIPYMFLSSTSHHGPRSSHCGVTLDQHLPAHLVPHLCEVLKHASPLLLGCLINHVSHVCITSTSSATSCVPLLPSRSCLLDILGVNIPLCHYSSPPLYKDLATSALPNPFGPQLHYSWAYQSPPSPFSLLSSSSSTRPGSSLYKSPNQSFSLQTFRQIAIRALDTPHHLIDNLVSEATYLWISFLNNVPLYKGNETTSIQSIPTPPLLPTILSAYSTTLLETAFQYRMPIFGSHKARILTICNLLSELYVTCTSGLTLNDVLEISKATEQDSTSEDYVPFPHSIISHIQTDTPAAYPHASLMLTRYPSLDALRKTRDVVAIASSIDPTIIDKLMRNDHDMYNSTGTTDQTSIKCLTAALSIVYLRLHLAMSILPPLFLSTSCLPLDKLRDDPSLMRLACALYITQESTKELPPHMLPDLSGVIASTLPCALHFLALNVRPEQLGLLAVKHQTYEWLSANLQQMSAPFATLVASRSVLFRAEQLDSPLPAMYSQLSGDSDPQATQVDDDIGSICPDDANSALPAPTAKSSVGVVLRGEAALALLRRLGPLPHHVLQLLSPDLPHQNRDTPLQTTSYSIISRHDHSMKTQLELCPLSPMEVNTLLDCSLSDFMRCTGVGTNRMHAIINPDTLLSRVRVIFKSCQLVASASSATQELHPPSPSLPKHPPTTSTSSVTVDSSSYAQITVKCEPLGPLGNTTSTTTGDPSLVSERTALLPTREPAPTSPSPSKSLVIPEFPHVPLPDVWSLLNYARLATPYIALADALTQVSNANTSILASSDTLKGIEAALTQGGLLSAASYIYTLKNSLPTQLTQLPTPTSTANPTTSVPRMTASQSSRSLARALSLSFLSLVDAICDISTVSLHVEDDLTSITPSGAKRHCESDNHDSKEDYSSRLNRLIIRVTWPYLLSGVKALAMAVDSLQRVSIKISKAILTRNVPKILAIKLNEVYKRRHTEAVAVGLQPPALTQVSLLPWD